MNIESQCKRFLKERAEVCNRKRRELADEFATEIRFGSSIQTNADKIGMEDITDFSSLFGGAAAVTALIPGIGWGVSIGLGLLSLFSDSKEQKIREAKATLRKKLKEAMGPAVDKIGNQMVNIINDEILHKGIDDFRQSLVDMDEMFFELAAEQENLANDLKHELQLSNAVLWDQAVRSAALSMQQGEVGDYVQNLRIPGRAFVLFSEQHLPNKVMGLVKELIGEPVRIVEADPDDADEVWNAQEELANQLLKEDAWEMSAFEYGSEDDTKVYYTSLYDEEIEEDSVAYRLVQQMFYQPILRY